MKYILRIFGSKKEKYGKASLNFAYGKPLRTDMDIMS